MDHAVPLISSNGSGRSVQSRAGTFLIKASHVSAVALTDRTKTLRRRTPSSRMPCVSTGHRCCVAE
jgi:hypothetical protein